SRRCAHRSAGVPSVERPRDCRGRYSLCRRVESRARIPGETWVANSDELCSRMRALLIGAVTGSIVHNFTRVQPPELTTSLTAENAEDAEYKDKGENLEIEH